MGASGYTGSETLRLLMRHPYVKIIELIAEKNAGKNISEVFSNFNGSNLPIIKSLENTNFSNVDVLFSCAPSGVLADYIDKLHNNLVIIDLSSDFRFKDVVTYNSYYGTHKNPSFLPKFCYGLSEIYREEIREKQYISCPGCYPTSVLLPLVPLLKEGLIKNNEVIIDSKSGITGAGRNISQDLLFSENFGSVKAYGNGNHRHKPEIEHILQLTTSKSTLVTFTPHIIPINRGILSSIYLQANYDEVKENLESFYNSEKFVKVENKGVTPKISDVVGSNLCRLGIIKNNNSNWITIISAIDNLIKGASGQAVQNFNIRMNYQEDLGLDNQSLSP